MARPEPIEFSLPNRMRVIVVPNRSRALVSSRLYLAEGSLFDPIEASGATFIAVAMLGEGHEVDQVGRPLWEEKTLRRELFERGALYDFDVGHDYAYIGVTGYARDLADHLEGLARAVKKPRRGEGAFAGYQTALVHSAEEVQPEDEQTFRALLARAAFGSSHPYGRAPTGSIGDLRKLGYHQVIARQDILLDPARSTLVVAGPVDPAGVQRMAVAALGSWRRRLAKGQRRPPLPVAPPPAGAAIGVAIPPAELVTACAARTLPAGEADDEPLDLLIAVLGDGFGSRLHQRLRIEMGATYGTSSFVVPHRHARAIIACCQAEKGRAGEALSQLLATIEGLRENPPTEDEVRRVQAMRSSRDRSQPTTIAGALEAVHEPLVLYRAPTRRSPRGSEVETLRALSERLMHREAWQVVLTGPPAAARSAARQSGLRFRAFRP